VITAGWHKWDLSKIYKDHSENNILTFSKENYESDICTWSTVRFTSDLKFSHVLTVQQ